MSKTVIGLGVVLFLLGLWILVVPDQFMSMMDWESRQALYVAAGVRILIGLLLVLSASATRYPKGMRIFGGLVVVAGLIILFLPLDLWGELIRWAMIENRWWFRVGGGIGGMLMGAFFVHAGSPRSPD